MNLFKLDTNIVNLFKTNIINAINENDSESIICIFDMFQKYLALKTSYNLRFQSLIKKINNFKQEIFHEYK